MDEHFFLQWENFQGNLKSYYTKLRENNQFSDVTLSCEGGQQVKAHKIILSGTSKLFDEMLIQNDHPKPHIHLRGIHINQLNFLMDYIYYGEVQVPTNTIQEFMAMAEDFKVNGLTGQKGTHEENNIKLERSQEYSVSEIASPEYVCPISETTSNSKAFDDSGVGKLKTSVGLDIYADQIKCDACGKLSKTRGGLDKHILRAHAGGQYKCDTCGKQRRTQSGLYKHILITHGDKAKRSSPINTSTLSFKTEETELNSTYKKPPKQHERSRLSFSAINTFVLKDKPKVLTIEPSEPPKANLSQVASKLNTTITQSNSYHQTPKHGCLRCGKDSKTLSGLIKHSQRYHNTRKVTLQPGETSKFT